MNIASEHGYAQQMVTGTIREGVRLAEQGQVEEGYALVRQGLAAWRHLGVQLRQPLMLALLADALLKAEHAEEGLRAVAEAIECVNRTGERWYEAELYRLKGELLRSQLSANDTEAEICFHQAISIAQSQSAKSWELRAAMSLARLWQRQGKRDEAWQLLHDVYSWFTEGLDTADLQDAKGLLDALSP
jgi:predicted ATPase